MASLRAMNLVSKWQIKQCVNVLRFEHGLLERRTLYKWSPLFANEKNENETHTEATMNSIRGRDVEFSQRHVQSVDEEGMDSNKKIGYDETGEIRTKDITADSRMNIYESSNINLSSCMQSTVPQPFDGTKSGSDHVSPINMPGGSSRRDAKYISGNQQDTHQSRHFSTFVCRMQANKENKPDSEFVVKGRFLEDAVDNKFGYVLIKNSRDNFLSFALLYVLFTGISYGVYTYLIYKEVPFERFVDVSRLVKIVSKMRVNEDEFDGFTHFQMCQVFSKCHFWWRLTAVALFTPFVTFAMRRNNVRFYGPIQTLFKFDKWLANKVKD